MKPHIDIAQATILGHVMARPEAAALVFATVPVEDFDNQYRYIAEAIHGLRVARAPVSSLAVIDEATRRGTLGRIGGASEIMRVSGHDFGEDAMAAALVIASRHARLRRIHAYTTDVRQRLEQREDADPLMLGRAFVRFGQGIVDRCEADADDVTTPTVDEFLGQEDQPYDWVVPDLLERGDRVVFTGSEGLGKSVLMRQIGVTAASGVHPFHHRLIPQQRVLIVDCENGVSKLRRALRPLVAQGRGTGADPSAALHIEARPAGMDLTTVEDEAWLVRRVATLQPSILIIGPLYRLHAQNPNDEQPAREVARVLDRCREAANCALVLEAHAGHGDSSKERPLRPTGSSLWLRWPEFGYGMRSIEGLSDVDRQVDLIAWRGDREERQWPTRLASGGTWPWQRPRVQGLYAESTPA